jgi:hypothetical protein
MTGVAGTVCLSGATFGERARLWRLIELGILGEALNAEERVSPIVLASLREAAVRGLRDPPPRWTMPVRTARRGL